MYCSQCGTALPDDVAFCSSCGSPTGAGERPAAAPGAAHEPGVGDADAPGSAPAAPAPGFTPEVVAAGAPAAAAAPPPWSGAPAAPQWGGPAAVAAVRYAGFWRRFAAWFLDMILLQLAGLLVAFAGGVRLFDSPNFDTAYLLVSFASIVISWLYQALLESSSQQATIGQLALSIRVTDVHGRRLSFGRATGRHFAQIISGLTLGIGYLMIAFTARKQALHDIIAGCLLEKRVG